MTMMWVGIGSVVVGAGTSLYAANQSSNAVNDASKRATGVELQMYNQSRADLAPYRAAGYGALDQINQLYGISAGPSAEAAQYAAYSPISVRGGGGAAQYGPNPNPLAGLAGGPLDSISKNPLDSLFGGGGTPNFGGTIDPRTGTVSVTGHSGRDAALTQYLRTGTWPEGINPGKHNKTRDLIAQIDKLRASGWQYDPNRTAAGGAGTSGAAPQRDLSAFYTSPQYNFVKDEGMDAIKNLASTRGGIGGNVMREGARFGAGLASGEFNSYVDRLMSIAGLGGSATSQGVSASQNTGNSLANIYTNAGNSRASSYVAGAGGVNNAIQGGLQNWAFNNYLNSQTPQSTFTPAPGMGIMPLRS